MAKIAVFDSGLGSLSIIRPIRKTSKSEIIYFADQANYPYGLKTKRELNKIILKSIEKIEKIFDPDVIVVGSNTPSLFFQEIFDKKKIGVFPPIRNAEKISNTKSIGILATQSITKSRELTDFINKNILSNSTRVFKINASPLVDLVESGKFFSNKSYCNRIIKDTLKKKVSEKNIDVVTLSSTHLPFLLPLLRHQFPEISFLDPSENIAKMVSKKTKNSTRNKLTIYASGDVQLFQKKLTSIGITNQVKSLTC